MGKLTNTQITFYQEKYQTHKNSPKSLSYNDKVTQYLRFQRISRLFEYEAQYHFTVHEIGFGLAHFYQYLLKNTLYQFEYSGSEIVPEFVQYSQKQYPDLCFYLRDITKETVTEQYDYLTLSGTFNPVEDIPMNAWTNFIHQMMVSMFRMAKKGIAVNFITTYCDYMDQKLYHGDPKKLYDFIQKNLSRFFTIDNSYPLYEFTVLIYKENFIKKVFYQKNYRKYFKTE